MSPFILLKFKERKEKMKRFKERLIALLSAAAIVVSSSGIAALAYTKDQLPS